ncbi:MAG: MBOAT family protein [Dehalococcoidia bacterium]|nr:MBOAT family protein [Dehalococcoidia bacterium]
MVFSSISFLFVFLPAVLLLYYAVPQRFLGARNGILLAASLLFYFYGEQLMVLALLFSVAINYTCSLLIERFRGERIIPKITLAVSLLANLGLLGYFKYCDFFIENINSMLNISLPLLKAVMPIGISFYTFQNMSYTVDIYLARTKAQRNLVKFATYVAMFPQLVAGPIVRYTEVERELDNRAITIAGFSYGVRRFVLGLAKKVLVANTMAELGSIISYSGESSVLFAWMGAAAFFFQIYFDFSGYSDMAIGLGAMLGFKFPENFNLPYMARSVTDFWRRWHMTLSRWFRDYIYIPLGGNRVSKPKWFFNIAVVWLLTGFWHGASWNFIAWGLYFAALLALEKLVLLKVLGKIPRVFGHIFAMAAVFFGFVIFNADTLSEVGRNFAAMSGMGGRAFWGVESRYYLSSYAGLFAIAAVASTPLVAAIGGKLRRNMVITRVLDIAEPVAIMALLLLTVGFLVDGSFNPFLYFRF